MRVILKGEFFSLGIYDVLMLFTTCVRSKPDSIRKTKLFLSAEVEKKLSSLAKSKRSSDGDCVLSFKRCKVCSQTSQITLSTESVKEGWIPVLKIAMDDFYRYEQADHESSIDVYVDWINNRCVFKMEYKKVETVDFVLSQFVSKCPYPLIKLSREARKELEKYPNFYLFTDDLQETILSFHGSGIDYSIPDKPICEVHVSVLSDT
jgi:hypothetical protein